MIALQLFTRKNKGFTILLGVRPIRTTVSYGGTYE